MSQFQTRYGHFSDEGWEYVIVTPKTPKPWINVISNGHYGLLISQSGGGFSWLDDCNQNRITRWNQDLVLDDWGKFFYLRDEETGFVWSPTYRPAEQELDEFSCRHGIGYTIFQATSGHMQSELRVFIPWEHNLEIWTIRLTNVGRKTRHLGLFTYLEWCLGTGHDQHREFHKLFLETEFDPNRKAVLARKRLWDVPSTNAHWNRDWPWIAYLAASESFEEYETDKALFFGARACLSNPEAVARGQLSCTTGKWSDAVGSIHKRFVLRPGETRELHVFLGVASSLDEVDRTLQHYRKEGEVERAFEGVKSKWRDLLGKTWIETPDPATDVLANIWLKYQAISGRLWGRAGYFQQSGAYGFRDQLQDSQIFLYLDPGKTFEQIQLHAAHQFSDGHVLHWWSPLTDVGHDVPVSDNLLWLPFVTVNYVKETGNFGALQTEVPFYRSGEAGTLLDHCLRAIELALERRSERGLPLILACDWNDGLSAVGLGGKGESVWLGHFLVYLLNEFAGLLDRLDMRDRAQRYRKQAAYLREALSLHGWDSAWFLRATKDNGGRIGSASNDEGKIFLNPQTWAILAESCSRERMRAAFQSVLDILECEAGPRLLAPAYTRPDEQIGYITRYAPGVRENGGVYVHAATWAIWAACKLGLADVAFRFYRKINPVLNGLDPNRYQVEPYVTAGHIHGSDSPHCGRGGWTWYTGSAAWLFRVLIDQIIGVRADYDGLVVEPCYPPDWKTIRLRRLYRGCTYHIELQHEESLDPGEVRIMVDDRILAKGEKHIPLCEKPTCRVRVEWRQRPPLY